MSLTNSTILSFQVFTYSVRKIPRRIIISPKIDSIFALMEDTLTNLKFSNDGISGFGINNSSADSASKKP
jgi:hypothetical protein